MIKVLLVDDDFLVRTFLSRVTDWEKHGYTLVGAAQDGEEALHMVQEYQPDIIITDISMPVMDGIELIRRLKQAGNTAKMIALSCHDDFDYVKEAMKLGIDEYILKNLLTEESLLKLLDEMKRSIVSTNQSGLQFHAPDEEREYYLQLLRGGEPKPEDSFVASAAMAVSILNYDTHVAIMPMEQQKRFHSSFAQICREACQNASAVRCVHVKQGLYAVLLDFTGIPSVYERREKIQQYASAAVRYVEQYLAISVCIGTSRVESFQTSLQQCWEQAKDAGNERFYAPQTVFYGWQVQEMGKEIPELARQFSENIAGYIARKEGGMIRQQWEAVLEEFRLQHTQQWLVEEWLRQTDREAGIKQRAVPSRLDQFRGLEAAYITFKEEMLPELDHYSSAVNQTIRYLQRNHKNDASLQEAAEQVHLNAAYLSHIFSKETGITFSEYLLSCRINTAKELLVHTGDKIRDVGAQSGFHDYRNFCKTFKRVTGVTPQNYRKQCN
ncbi:MAG: response regulator [Eubacteriales bacterium]|nr:response regulator [Eubacteriales bacterium]